MHAVIEILLAAGRSAIDLALYTLLPIMIAMMILMRLLEVHGLLDRFVRVVEPLVRPFGLTGLGIVAMLQISFISFVAPVTTLKLMDDRGETDRRLATAFAAILAMAPANAVFPLAALGLSTGLVLLLSLLGGLIAAAATWWAFGRHLPATQLPISAFEREAHQRPTFLSIVNVSGREAIEIVLNIIPVLLLSLATVFACQKIGIVDALAMVMAPALQRCGIDPSLILPSLTKFLAGSTALVGVAQHMAGDGHLTAVALNQGSGLLLHPFDLPGVAIFASAGRRMGKVLLPALAGAASGILLRALGTAVIF